MAARLLSFALMQSFSRTIWSAISAVAVLLLFVGLRLIS
jgi:hypothetical protein